MIFGIKQHHQPKSNDDHRPKGNDDPIDFNNIIDVVQYGAAGDGKTDDSQVNIHTPRLFEFCI